MSLFRDESSITAMRRLVQPSITASLVSRACFPGSATDARNDEINITTGARNDGVNITIGTRNGGLNDTQHSHPANTCSILGATLKMFPAGFTASGFFTATVQGQVAIVGLAALGGGGEFDAGL